MSEFLNAALEAASAATEIITRLYRGNCAVRLKADKSPVTDADVAAERAIRGVIEKRFPRHGFYGEETGKTRADAEFLWIVDPIDGTKAFVREYEMFSTQIALMHRGQLIVGVSSAQPYGELAHAERGEGAFLNGERIRVSSVARIEEASLSTGNLRSMARSARWPRYGELVSRLDRIRGYGDFLHYHLLASGRIEGVVESDINVLDIAALAMIIEEAGGQVTDLDGGPVRLEMSSILATNGVMHQTFLEALGAAG